MIRISSFVLFLAALALLSGYLMSKASLIGRLGMTFIFEEYAFLKIWWQGALAVFAAWMFLLLIQSTISMKISRQKARFIHFSFIVLALVGLYFTFTDFQTTTTHRWLKERFHLGAYLFWFGWIIISIFCIARNPGLLPERTSL